MNIFNFITMFGGLAMFLYGMRLMSSSLKQHSSGALKAVMSKLTDNPIKAFLLGVVFTAVIQSSTATIVITSGLVAAGILSLHQSIGIIVGANVGTTVTGQIIRLLDLNKASGWLEFFKPSTLAPLALILGIIMIMGFKKEGIMAVGNVAMGFGILFSGLLSMTNSVSDLSQSGVFDTLFMKLDTSPLFGYLIGATVAFILQSSSATVGILQAFSMTGMLSFKGIYATLVGVYLGDCVTTAIVCSIGAKPDARRVGIINILFNLGKTALVLVVVTIVHQLGLLNQLWDAPLSSGGIANTNTIFNIVCSVLLFPFLHFFENMSRKIVKDEPVAASKYEDKINALNPIFVDTPAIALQSCYELLHTMLTSAQSNINKAFQLFYEYDEKLVAEINAEEAEIDYMTDKLSNYLIELSKGLNEDVHIRLMNEYYKVVTQAERLGDHAVNICEAAVDLHNNNFSFSDTALNELKVIKSLLDEIGGKTLTAFDKLDAALANEIEPLEEVVDDMVNTLRDNHLERLRLGKCNIIMDKDFLNLLMDIERISDICSNIGLAIVARSMPELESQTHDYVSKLHQGSSEAFNISYKESHKKYFDLLEKVSESQAN